MNKGKEAKPNKEKRGKTRNQKHKQRCNNAAIHPGYNWTDTTHNEKHHIDTAVKPHTKLQQQLVHQKITLDKKCNIRYGIPCKLCNRTYIGVEHQAECEEETTEIHQETRRNSSKGGVGVVEDGHSSRWQLWRRLKLKLVSRSDDPFIILPLSDKKKLKHCPWCTLSSQQPVLQGPDVTTSLIGVLTKFPQEPAEMRPDLNDMYHQVKVAKQ